MGREQPVANTKFKQESNQFMDMQQTPGSLISQNQYFQQQAGHSRHQMTNSVLTQKQHQTAGAQSSVKASKQAGGSKLRKNVSAMRGGASVGPQNQGKNIQRVSQQRRFNNTTLDNYQQPATMNQLNTIHQNVQNIMGNMSNMNIGSVQYRNDSQSRTLVPQGSQAQGQSRSVMRQIQQQKQYLNNFLPPNKFGSGPNTGATGSTIISEAGKPAPKMKDTSNMRINNHFALNKPDRAQSTLKPMPNQNFQNPMGTQPINLQQIDGGGQSPLLKQNLQLIHKRSESVTNQRPPEHIQVGSNHQQSQGKGNLIPQSMLYQKYYTGTLSNAGNQAKIPSKKQGKGQANSNYEGAHHFDEHSEPMLSDQQQQMFIHQNGQPVMVG